MTPVSDAHARRRLQLYRCHCRIAYKLIIYLVKITLKGLTNIVVIQVLGPCWEGGLSDARREQKIFFVTS